MYNNSGGSGTDVSMTVRVAPSTYTIYSVLFMANSTSPWSAGGSYGWLEVDTNGTVVLNQAINTSFTQIALVSAHIHDNSTIRVVAGWAYGPGQLGAGVYVDGALVLSVPYSAGGGTYNGAGIQQVDAPGEGDLISSVSLANLVTTPPTAIPSASISATTGYNYIDLQWPAASDPTGPGISNHTVSRNGQLLCTTQSLACADTTVRPNTAYTYTVTAIDYDFNSASTSINATAPAVPTNPPYPSTRQTGSGWACGPPARIGARARGRSTFAPGI